MNITNDEILGETSGKVPRVHHEIKQSGSNNHENLTQRNLNRNGRIEKGFCSLRKNYINHRRAESE